MKKILTGVLFLLSIHLFWLSNLQFTAWPEMLSFPYLLNNGFSLYGDMVHPYPPLLTIILSHIYQTFGTSVIVLKYTTWVLILISSIFIFLLVRLISKNTIIAFITLSFYVFTQPFLEGNMLWFDFATVPFFLAGFYVFLKSRENGYKNWHTLAFSGFLLFLSFLVKQTAALYFLIIGVYLFFETKSIKNILQFSFAPFFMGIIIFLKLIAKSRLIDFLNWTLLYPMKFWTSFPDYVQMNLDTRESMIIVILFVPILIFVMKNKSIMRDSLFVFLSSLLVGALFAVYPRFSFYHFQAALATIALIFAYTFPKKIDALSWGTIFFATFSLFILVVWPAVTTKWNLQDRFAGDNDFHLTQKIKENVSHNETIYLLGPHSAHYVFTDRLPPEPWYDNFGWYFEIPDVQENVLSRWKGNPPQYILWNEPEKGEWYELGTYQPDLITEWIREEYTKGEELSENSFLWVKKE